MCKKLPYCARKIDPCLLDKIKRLRRDGFNTISSCCGHGKYRPTVVVREHDNHVYELYSGITLNAYNPKFDKRHNTYYKRDNEGYYYIPEVENIGKK